ncbi:MAG: hypothetical protein ACFB0D_00110 [Phormidesmis sp.]
MAISLSLYDFFAHLVPGSVFLIAIMYGFQETWMKSPAFTTFTTAQLIGLGLVAYVLGYLIDPLGNRWYRFFRKNTPKFGLSEEAAVALQKNHPNIVINPRAMSWYVLLAYIKRQNLPMAQEIERFNVTHIMLRGISFSLISLAGVCCFKIFTASPAWPQALLSLVCMGAAYLLMQEAIKFRIWFYQSIYQSVIALELKPEQLPVGYRK